MKDLYLFLLQFVIVHINLYCRIAEIPEVINHIKKSFASENSENAMSETCPDKENNETLEAVIEPLKVFILKIYVKMIAYIYILLRIFSKSWHNCKSNYPCLKQQWSIYYLKMLNSRFT